MIVTDSGPLTSVCCRSDVVSMINSETLSPATELPESVSAVSSVVVNVDVTVNGPFVSVEVRTRVDCDSDVLLKPPTILFPLEVLSYELVSVIK